MAVEFIQLHPDNPHDRKVNQIVDRLRQGAIIAYPTDSCYAFGCHIGDKAAVDKIKRIRQVDKHHNMTLMCSDMAQIAQYARVDNWQFRMLRNAAPGPYTFVLSATLQVPRRLHTGKRKTIGVRVPSNNIAQALLAALGEPLLSCTAILHGRELPFHDAEEIRDELPHELDLIVDGGFSDMQPTTVVDLSTGEAVLQREGKGDLAALGL